MNDTDITNKTIYLCDDTIEGNLTWRQFTAKKKLLMMHLHQ
jgi:hypothetical protein